jgi:hypothetical protein
MTEQLADLLARRLAVLPLADRLVGLVRPYRHDIDAGEGTTRSITLPVPVVLEAPDCEADARYLVPDLNTASILFFEDHGTVRGGITNVPDSWTSTLRLLGWVNPQHYASRPTDLQLVTALQRGLKTAPLRTSEAEYVDLLINLNALPADAGLFSRYTDLPLLHQPYRMVGLELTCTYRLAACATEMPARTGGTSPLSGAVYPPVYLATYV